MSTDPLSELPVFPLPRLVFLPGSLLPLNMFEPRYRALSRYCIEGDRALAVGAIAPGHEREQPGDPPVVEIMGVGRIQRHRELPDGRFHLVLAGTGRVRLEEELPRLQGFRRFRCSSVPELPADPVAACTSFTAIRACVNSLLPHWPAAGEVIGRALDDIQDPGALADRLGSLVLSDAVQRQELLACPAVEERLELVLGRLAVLVCEAGAASEA